MDWIKQLVAGVFSGLDTMLQSWRRDRALTLEGARKVSQEHMEGTLDAMEDAAEVRRRLRTDPDFYDKLRRRARRR